MQINSSLKPFSFSEKLLFKSFQDKKLDGQVINKSFELKNKGIIDKIEHLFTYLFNSERTKTSRYHRPI